MPAVVVYESMFGSTRSVAEAIARGYSRHGEVIVVPVRDVGPELVGAAELLLVGGPTHMHSMTRPLSRRIAARMAAGPASRFTLEPGAGGPGLREWLAGLSPLETPFAAFDTRAAGPALMTGRAAARIHRELRRLGARAVAHPHSFVIGAGNKPAPGELSRAEEWGAGLARATAAVHSPA